MLIKWISFYKAHRSTLIQPMVHIRRATMQSWDGWMHVNPLGLGRPGKAVEHVEVGLAMLFNPTDTALRHETVALPLYYTGIELTAWLSVDGDPVRPVTLQRDYTAHITIDMEPRSVHTVVVTSTEFGA